MNNKRLLDAAKKILDWYDDEDNSNPHSTEKWQEAYNELRESVTELNERNSVDEGEKSLPCQLRGVAHIIDETGICKECGEHYMHGQ